MITVSGLRARLGRAEVLHGIDLSVEAGSWTTLLGPNGAGKSTLLRCAASLVPHTGTIHVDGADLATLSPRERARLIGYAPQVPLIPEGMPVRDYVMLGRMPHHRLLAAPGTVDANAVHEAIERLNLTHLASRRMGELSGGERHRAVLARALAQQARILLLDEPTASLDLGHAQGLLDLVDDLRREQGLTVLSALHDLTLAGQYANQVVVLCDGAVVADGAPADVLTEDLLAERFGARAVVVNGPDGVRVVPVRRPSVP